MPTSPQRILICGSRSFAATGLVERLRARGHDCIGFTRGRVGREGDTVTGPVDGLHENPHLTGKFDAVDLDTRSRKRWRISPMTPSGSLYGPQPRPVASPGEACLREDQAGTPGAVCQTEDWVLSVAGQHRAGGSGPHSRRRRLG